jgi:hypothetical protein
MHSTNIQKIVIAAEEGDDFANERIIDDEKSG